MLLIGVWLLFESVGRRREAVESDVAPAFTARFTVKRRGSPRSKREARRCAEPGRPAPAAARRGAPVHSCRCEEAPLTPLRRLCRP